MARSVKQIIEGQMPGWRLEQEDEKAALDAAKARAAPPDQVGKSDDALKRKYLGKSRVPVADSARRESADSAGRVKFVRVVEQHKKDAAVGSKTVLVDTVSGKVKGVQG